MRNMWVIFKKELFRVLTDKRLVLTVFILPGLSIFLIYSIMGEVIGSQFEEDRVYDHAIYAENMPESLEASLEEVLTFHAIEGDYDRETLENMVREEELELALFFEEDFEDKIEAYQTGTDIPQLVVYYNQGHQHSSTAHNRFMQVMNVYHESIIRDRLEDPDDYHPYQLSSENFMDERTVAARGIAMLMPMLVIIFLFVGAMSIGPDAIAGEKERGTIATLLVTPTRRRDIALGKVSSIAVLSLMSALSSFAGILLSLPRLMQFGDEMPDIGIYRLVDFFAIFAVLLTTVVFIVSLIAIISTYAKTIKEANMLIMPFYFVAMIVGILNSFGAEPNHSLWVHFFPIYAPINALSGILMFEYSPVNLVITLLMNLVYSAIFVYILNKMFDNEKVMFTR